MEGEDKVGSNKEREHQSHVAAAAAAIDGQDTTDATEELNPSKQQIAKIDEVDAINEEDCDQGNDLQNALDKFLDEPSSDPFLDMNSQDLQNMLFTQGGFNMSNQVNNYLNNSTHNPKNASKLNGNNNIIGNPFV